MTTTKTLFSRSGACTALCALSLALPLAACGPAANPPSATASPSHIPAPADNSSGPPVNLGAGAPPTATTPAPGALPAFGPARGVNADLMFAERLDDPDQRFQRLENAVADMRHEMDNILLSALPPAPVTESAISASVPISDVEQLNAAKQKPAAAPTPKKAVTDAPAVKAVRTGLHEGGINRLVLDLTGASSFSVDLDNTERLLVVEIPGAGWSAAKKGIFKNMPLLASWSTETLESGKGTRLVIQLSGAVKITGKSALKSPDRIVIDLKKSP